MREAGDCGHAGKTEGLLFKFGGTAPLVRERYLGAFEALAEKPIETNRWVKSKRNRFLHWYNTAERIVIFWGSD